MIEKLLNRIKQGSCPSGNFPPTECLGTHIHEHADTPTSPFIHFPCLRRAVKLELHTILFHLHLEEENWK